jgi:diaminopimelate epimerase
MKLDIVRADPAGNITIFVLDPVEGSPRRAALAKALLAEPSLKAEQVGFVIPPALGGLWRLEMMGGEFCGNAARSFGLYAGRESGLTGKQDISVEISGSGAPVLVHADFDALTAELELPGPRGETVLSWGGRSFPAYFFDGITQVIAEGVEPGRDHFNLGKQQEEMVLGLLDKVPPSALGVMFYDPLRRFMRPAVYVFATESLVFESSCGSGTAALAVYLSAGIVSGEETWKIAQPGGVIEARVKKAAGKITTAAIGGPVTLDPRRGITV